MASWLACGQEAVAARVACHHNLSLCVACAARVRVVTVTRVASGCTRCRPSGSSHGRRTSQQTWRVAGPTLELTVDVPALQRRRQRGGRRGVQLSTLVIVALRRGSQPTTARVPAAPSCRCGRRGGVSNVLLRIPAFDHAGSGAGSRGTIRAPRGATRRRKRA